jgi:hypothetical protein
MPAYLVRTIDEHDLVGIFVAPSVGHLALILDEGIDPGVCEYQRMGPGGIMWTSDAVVPLLLPCWWGTHFPLAFSCVRLGSSTGPFLFWRNAKPINPSTTKTAPATINQCGYCIADSITIFPFRLQPQSSAIEADCAVLWRKRHRAKCPARS